MSDTLAHHIAASMILPAAADRTVGGDLPRLEPNDAGKRQGGTLRCCALSRWGGRCLAQSNRRPAAARAG